MLPSDTQQTGRATIILPEIQQIVQSRTVWCLPLLYTCSYRKFVVQTFGRKFTTDCFQIFSEFGNGCGNIVLYVAENVPYALIAFSLVMYIG